MTKVATPGQTFTFAYSIGETVFHRMADGRKPGMVTGLAINPGGQSYYVTWPGGNELRHYEIELSSEYIPDFSQG